MTFAEKYYPEPLCMIGMQPTSENRWRRLGTLRPALEYVTAIQMLEYFCVMEHPEQITVLRFRQFLRGCHHAQHPQTGETLYGVIVHY